AHAAGLHFLKDVMMSHTADTDALIDRLVEIERRTWKGAGSKDDLGDKSTDNQDSQPTGIVAPDMQVFCRRMTARLIANDRARITVARLDGEDVGYILGGVRNGRYRGLQLSYTTEVAPFSVGHLLQLEELRNLSSTGIAHTYDLGMDIAYKHAWADRLERSVTLIVERGS
ncbi:MAG: GNAT family N-acetyltransferase, partial [Actinomycetota bacterium]|nr:GNAT family N-acetyltransferase [Actinomycetota bacterium]